MSQFKRCIYYLKTKDDAEIDLIVDRPGLAPALIEIKSKTEVDERDTRHLINFRRDFDDPLLLLLTQSHSEQNIEGVTACHWREGITRLLCT